MKRILWVEDETDTSLLEFRTILEMNLDYDLEVSRNASNAIELLKKEVFNAIIIDVRIPPGEQSIWIKRYMKNQNGIQQFEQLGVYLIYEIFSNNEIQQGNRVYEKIGIFTIERPEDILSISKKISKEEKLEEKLINKVHYHYKKNAEQPEDFEIFVKKLLNGESPKSWNQIS